MRKPERGLKATTGKTICLYAAVARANLRTANKTLAVILNEVKNLGRMGFSGHDALDSSSLRSSE